MEWKVTKFNGGYNGGKEAAGTYQKIINEIREHDIMICGFLGHCAIARNIEHKSRIIGIDIDPSVIAAWGDMSWPWIELICGDFVSLVPSLLSTIGAGKKIVIYCDPPYLMESIKSDIPPYKYTMPASWHRSFLSMIAEIGDISGVDILISHYPCDMYESSLKGWRVLKYKSTTRRGTATELLFMNYSHDDGKLQDYQFVGDNKDERYNLKHRAATNLISKLNRMDPRKKQALLHYLRADLASL